MVQFIWYKPIQIFYFFLVWALTDCTFQGIGSIHLGYQLCAHCICLLPTWDAHNIVLLSFNVHGICSDLSSFISDFSNLRFLLFFLLAWPEAYWFNHSLKKKKKSFWFFWFSLLILFAISLIYVLISIFFCFEFHLLLFF